MGQQTHDKAVHLSDMNSTQDPFMTSTLISRGCLLARDNHEGLSFTCLFGSKKNLSRLSLATVRDNISL